ncbi:MAG TPA: histidine--tRNA ligase [Mucilaginibacter sp.]|nr:histidine--tRNA ligase [Mucilaginibacter sp.]
MASIKPSVPKGTRDFSPTEMVRRNFIFDTIKGVFRKYGYQQIETPSMENLSTLTGKYGDEGDKLIFKILESGDYSAKVSEELVKTFTDIIVIEEEVKKFFNKIANELASHIINLPVPIVKKNDMEIKEELSRYFHRENFLLNIKSPPEFFFQFKESYLTYLFKSSTDSNIKKFNNRFRYYLSFEQNNNRREEILKGFNNWLKNKSAIKLTIKNEIGLRFKQHLSPYSLTPKISEKALRYDLTVPFARYVVMHQNDIAFPFKRFQVQPVWRADRPQKGRYREFYQCDADVVGSDSLLNEAEFVLIYDEALSKLGLKDFSIKINNRKILSGIAEIIDKSDNIVDLTVAIDKLDKIGLDGVIKELMDRGFSAEDIEKIKPVILLEGSNEEKLISLRSALANSVTGLKGCDEIETVLEYIAGSKLITAQLELDITLARGLNYYTGAIFEVKTNEVAMGSIGGGGRYDDLTGMFGLKGLTGVGISFGADRIYDVMDELNLFPENANQTTRLLICCFDKEGEHFAWPVLQQLRSNDINTELYPAGAKMKKQLDYANAKNIPYVMIIGSDEIQSGLLTVKDMRSGQQEKHTAAEVVAMLK